MAHGLQVDTAGRLVTHDAAVVVNADQQPPAERVRERRERGPQALLRVSSLALDKQCVSPSPINRRTSSGSAAMSGILRRRGEVTLPKVGGPRGVGTLHKAVQRARSRYGVASCNTPNG